MRSATTWLNPNRKMMDLLDERASSPSPVVVGSWVEGGDLVVHIDLPPLAGASTEAVATVVDGVLEVRIPLSQNIVLDPPPSPLRVTHPAVVRRGQAVVVRRPAPRTSSAGHDVVLP